MYPIRRANLRERSKAALLAIFLYWIVMTPILAIIYLQMRPLHGLPDFLSVAGVGLAGSVVFGLAMAFFQPLMAPPSPEADGGEEELGVPARLIPPSPVLGGKVFPDLNEPGN